MRLSPARRLLGGLPLALLFLLSIAPAAGAQAPPEPPEPQNPLYAFSLEVPDPQQTVPFGQPASFPFIFRDLSRDGSPNAAAPSVHVVQLSHYVTFTVTPQVEDAGWLASTPTPRPTYANDVVEDTVVMQSFPSATNPFYLVTLTATVRVQGGDTYEYNATLVGYSPGVKAFGVLSPPALNLGPSEAATVHIRVTNGGLLPRIFYLEQMGVTCGMAAVAPGSVVVMPKQTVEVPLTLRTPGAKPYYLGDQCQAQYSVRPEGDGGAGITVTALVTIDGAYVNPMWVFWTLFWILVFVLIVLFFKRRKERIEEELLGKPQKPWTIPVEALYLRALRQKDERAWYVVRHHLMEEEYRSALLWYKSYKKATKGTRKKEALVLRQEHAYEAWKAKWQTRIAKPIAKADRFEVKLQKKLDRRARKEDRKVARKVRMLTKKMSAAHAKQVERALEKWQKQVRKAEKKGLEAPPRPVLAEPDYPEEPEARELVLAEHKWSKKAARLRARRVREQGNLEVRFEKADARHLAKLRRKVQRLARKLDDPDFVAEHPLLRSDA